MPGDSIILAIRPVFAERILSGVKLFELRKAIPKRKVSRVYLYVSGGTGVIGCFSVSEIKSLPIDQLWDATGEAGTAKERFYKYFSGRTKGHAIGVSDPIRFSTPIFPQELKAAEERFVAPQGFLYVDQQSKLGRLLNTHRKKQSRMKSISLSPLKHSNSQKFIKLVTKTIGNRYDDISEKFAENIVKINFRGKDVVGVNTAKKEIFEVYKEKTLIGFTTLTHKFGFATKSGPSIIFPSFQGCGNGLGMRIAVDDYCRSIGRGKLYCTCPDDDSKLLMHLARSGYIIEGRLAAHYKPNRGDIVLGKQLSYSVSPAGELHFSNSYPFFCCELKKRNFRSLTKTIDDLATRYWGVQRSEDPQRIINVIDLKALSCHRYEDKGIAGYALSGSGTNVGYCLLMPKRGGSLKATVFSDSGDINSFASLFENIERVALQRGRRKVYSIIPFNFPSLIEVYRRHGFHGECFIQQAYSPNVDAVVMSKFV